MFTFPLISECVFYRALGVFFLRSSINNYANCCFVPDALVSKEPSLLFQTYFYVFVKSSNMDGCCLTQSKFKSNHCIRQMCDFKRLKLVLCKNNPKNNNDF